MTGSVLASLVSDSPSPQQPLVPQVPPAKPPQNASLTADLGIDDDDFDVSEGSEDGEEVYESPKFDSRKLSSPKPTVSASFPSAAAADSESEYETDDDAAPVAADSKPLVTGRAVPAVGEVGDEYTVEEIEEYDEDEGEEESVRYGDWEECFDKRYNRVYYYNVKTHESSWVLPKQ
jgi:hypothetical protein